MLEQVERYKQLVLQYEDLDEQIDTLLDAHGGTDGLPVDVKTQYRKLAHQRDELVNEIRLLQRVLFADDIEQ